MSTQLQIINKVLRRLREDTVATADETTYSKMVAEFLNEAKRYVEDAWDWLNLRQTVVVTTTSGTYSYTLTGAGDRYRILRDYSQDPLGWDVFDDTNDVNLQKAPSGYMTRMLLDNSPQSGNPIYFDINGQSGGDPQVNLWPIPGSTLSINFNMVIPQDDFAVDGSDDNTELTVPDWPVVLKCYALILGERGEDGGTSQAEAESRAEKALHDAIMLEMMMAPEEQVARIE